MDIRIAWNNTPGRLQGSKGQDAWILCSECSEPITKARPGIVLMDVPHPLPSDASVSFVHKTTCDDGVDVRSRLH